MLPNMYKKILSVFALFCFFSLTLSAQSFEGIVEMKQETAGMTYQVKWYIRQDRIAYELFSQSGRGAMQLRFIPQPEKGTMLLITNGGNHSDKKELSTKDITPSAGIDITNLQIEEIGEPRSQGEFRKVKKLVVRSMAGTVTHVDYTTDIDVHFLKYAAFLKEDYGIQALAQSGRMGFPIRSVTRDEKGKVIAETKLIRVIHMKMSDAYFR